MGKLGKGKTLSGVLEAYSSYCRGETVYSNLWLDFPHVPIKTPYDFLEIQEGFFLADEIWHLADCRKSASLLSDVITIILLRSRKRKFTVFYTQQYIQSDIRILYITDEWIKPRCFPPQPKDLRELKNYIPQVLIQSRFDAEGHKLPTKIIDPRPYLNLYDTNKDPYTLSSVIDSKGLKKILDRALNQDPKVEKEMKAIKTEAKTYARRLHNE